MSTAATPLRRGPARRRAWVALCVGGMLGSVSCARTAPSGAPTSPDTPAGHAFRTWLDAYDAADSAALEAYARQYEPAMSAHTQLVFRKHTGPWVVASIARSEPRRLEAALRARPASSVDLVPLTMYAAVAVDDVVDGVARLRGRLDEDARRRDRLPRALRPR